jgi:hypothetical protein
MRWVLAYLALIWSAAVCFCTIAAPAPINFLFGALLPLGPLAIWHILTSEWG